MQIGRIDKQLRLNHLVKWNQVFKRDKVCSAQDRNCKFGRFIQQMQRSAYSVSGDRTLQSGPRRRKMKRLFLKSQSSFLQSHKSTQLLTCERLSCERVSSRTHQGPFNYCCVSGHFKITQFENFNWGQ